VVTTKIAPPREKAAAIEHAVESSAATDINFILIVEVMMV